MIIFDRVSKSFWSASGRKVILEDASFSITTGDAVGIIAANGTGKSTLINMMGAIEKPDTGKIYRSCRVSFPLGYVGGIVLKNTGAENVRFVARLHGMDVNHVEAFARWMSGLGSYFDMKVGTYSQGMRARLSFSLMMALDFDIYLIDEGMPTTTDPAFNERVEAILQERLKHSGIIVVSHQYDTLQKYCSSAAILRNGKLHPYGSVHDAWSDFTQGAIQVAHAAR